jgi:hypothetical protein
VETSPFAPSLPNCPDPGRCQPAAEAPLGPILRPSPSTTRPRRRSRWAPRRGCGTTCAAAARPDSCCRSAAAPTAARRRPSSAACARWGGAPPHSLASLNDRCGAACHKLRPRVQRPARAPHASPPSPPPPPVQMVVRAVEAGDTAVLADARRIGRYGEGEAVSDARELAGRLFTTVYMGSENSSKETRDRWGGLRLQRRRWRVQRQQPLSSRPARALTPSASNRNLRPTNPPRPLPQRPPPQGGAAGVPGGRLPHGRAHRLPRGRADGAVHGGDWQDAALQGGRRQRGGEPGAAEHPGGAAGGGGRGGLLGPRARHRAAQPEAG